MNIQFPDTASFLQLVLFAAGIGWVITGSKIGRLARIFWHVATGWIPFRPLASLAFCPPCCTWWCGAALAFLAGWPWFNVLQAAFTSALLMAICNAQWQLDADDREDIERLLWPAQGELADKQKE
jgi:predicted MFS family arabinose efflux permease